MKSCWQPQFGIRHLLLATGLVAVASAASVYINLIRWEWSQLTFWSSTLIIALSLRYLASWASKSLGTMVRYAVTFFVAAVGFASGIVLFNCGDSWAQLVSGIRGELGAFALLFGLVFATGSESIYCLFECAGIHLLGGLRDPAEQPGAADPRIRTE